MKKYLRYLRPLLGLAVVAGLAAGGYFTRGLWLPLVQHKKAAAANDSLSAEKAKADSASTGKIILSDQAIANLNLTAKSVQPQTYWKTIQVPGMVVDRPGRSDLGIVSPVTGVVTKINYFPGDTVRPGDVLYTIHLLSESIHRTQSDLFKATQDIELAQATRQRLNNAIDAIPQVADHRGGKPNHPAGSRRQSLPAGIVQSWPYAEPD